MTFEDLKNQGRQWRNEFPNLQFLGQIEVGEELLRKLCPALQKHYRSSWNQDIRAALAVTVVNIAYYLPDEDHDSFRWQVLQRLGLPRDTNIWEHEIGPPIEKLLVEHFGQREAIGPYRYVAAILKQAGVPRRCLEPFADFFRVLISRFGWQFSQREYLGFCQEHEPVSRILAVFLPTETGWKFCQAVARVLHNRKDGIVAPAATLELPGFRGRILEDLWEHFTNPRIPNRTHDLPHPRVVLDLETLRLALEFSERGIPGSYVFNGNRVQSTHFALEEEHFRQPLIGRVIQPDGVVEEWTVHPWNPSQQRWAIFSSPGGVQQPFKPCVRPGRWLLALPESCNTDGLTVYEEFDCFHPASLEPVRILDCELRPGFAIPEIDLSVSESSTLPRLAFQKSSNQWPFAQNVFTGHLPKVEIINWTPDFGSQFALILERGQVRTRIHEDKYRAHSVFDCPLTAPTAGNICLEPKGIAPPGFEAESLSFVLLSCENLSWPTGLREEDELTTLRVEPSRAFNVNWRQPANLRQTDEGVWQVPGKVEFLEGHFSLDEGIQFEVSGPIYRFRVSGDCLSDGVLWREDINQPGILRLSFSPNEKGLQPQLGLVANDRFYGLADLPMVPAHGHLPVSTNAVRDALLAFGRPYGRIAARLPGGQVFRSSAVYVNEDEMLNRGFEDLGASICDLPTELVAAIDSVRELRDRPNPEFLFLPIGWPMCLDDFFKELRACSRAFDSGAEIPVLEELSNPPLEEMLDWYVHARAFVRQNRNFDQDGALALIAAFPQRGVTLPFPRWQQQFESVRSTILEIGNRKKSVREWGECCRREEWQTARNSVFGRMAGGGALTDGAQIYFYALERLQAGNHEEACNWLAGALEQMEIARKEATGLVRETASLLRLMVFFHYRHSDFTQQAREILEILNDEWAAAKQLIRRLLGEALEPADIKDSLSLSNISPHPYDRTIEENATHV